MNNVFIWSMEVDGKEHIWKCEVTDTECIFFEEEIESGRIAIVNPEKKQGILQIDDKVTVFGRKCPFQLENGVPYVKIEDRWVMSDTTMKARHQKMVYNQKVTGLVQIVVSAVIAVVYFVICRFVEGMSENWFVLIMASFFAIVGVAQFFTARKELKEFNASELEEI